MPNPNNVLAATEAADFARRIKHHSDALRGVIRASKSRQFPERDFLAEMKAEVAALKAIALAAMVAGHTEAVAAELKASGFGHF